MNPAIKITLIILCLQISTFCLAQEEYPYKIEKGKTGTIKAPFDIWVLKENQFDKALRDSKQLELIEKQNKILESKITLLQNKLGEKDSIMGALIQDRNFYKERFDTLNVRIDDLSRKTKRSIRRGKIYKKTTFIGIPAAFVLGILIVLF